jgi:hypothetical protein
MGGVFWSASAVGVVWDIFVRLGLLGVVYVLVFCCGVVRERYIFLSVFI